MEAKDSAAKVAKFAADLAANQEPLGVDLSGVDMFDLYTDSAAAPEGCGKQGYSGTTRYPDLMCTDGYMSDMDADGIDPSVARMPCPDCKPDEHKAWVSEGKDQDADSAAAPKGFAPSDVPMSTWSSTSRDTSQNDVLDAKRYRWLRRINVSHTKMGATTHLGRLESLDMAIDAALPVEPTLDTPPAAQTLTDERMLAVVESRPDFAGRIRLTHEGKLTFVARALFDAIERAVREGGQA